MFEDGGKVILKEVFAGVELLVALHTESESEPAHRIRNRNLQDWCAKSSVSYLLHNTGRISSVPAVSSYFVRMSGVFSLVSETIRSFIISYRHPSHRKASSVVQMEVCTNAKLAQISASQSI